MSRWLSQVNNLLEKLDDQVETVAEDGVPNVVHTVSSRAKQLLTNNNNNTSSDESFQHVSEAEQVYSADSEEDDNYDDEEGEEYEEDDDDDAAEEQEEGIGDIPSSPPSPTLPPAHVTSNRRTSSDDQLTAMSAITHDVQTEEEPESSQETSDDHGSIPERATDTVQPTKAKAPTQHHQQLKQQQQNTTRKWMQKMESMKSQHAADIRTLQSKHSKLATDLAATQKELSATRRELDQAAEIVQNERKTAAEEREDLLEEQEEDMQQCKQEYEEKLQDLRDEMKEQAAAYEAKLALQEEDFQEEGGNLTSDLTKLREQKNAALAEAQVLNSQVAELEAGRCDLEELVKAETARAQAAEDRASAAEKASAVVEERLDLIQASHQKQLQQRQVRETELERTVTELSQKVVSGSSAALAAAEKPSVPHNVEFKEKYEVVSEELVTVRTEAEMFKQRCHKLQNELSSLSEEHADQYQASQVKIRAYEEQVAALTAQTASVAPSSGIGDGQDLERLALELEQAKNEIGSLSDQLVRQKGLTETTKSNVLALKGRLQAATARADNAERSLQQQSSHAGVSDLEAGSGGGARQRRRIKGGSRVAATRFGQLPTRSIRNSLGLRTSTSRFQRQVGETLDALDTWILETGHILRNEPLARLGFTLYMALLHLWCFGLIVYHTVQSERTDFSALGDRSRIPHIHHAAAAATGSDLIHP